MDIKDVTAAVDYARADGMLLTLSNNMLFLLNETTYEVVSFTDIPVVNCKNLAYDETLGVFLFCISSQSKSGQILLQYKLNDDHFDLKNAFEIPAGYLVRQFDEMFPFYAAGTSYLLILDNDEGVDSNNKLSTVKVYSISQDTLAFVEEWNSKHFGTAVVYPINDLEVSNSFIFVTIGNYGMGYATFNQGKLIKPNNIKLSAIA